MRKAKSLLFLSAVLFFTKFAWSQPTFPENGVANPRHGHYAFTNATIVKDASTTISNATLIIKDGKIVAVGSNLKVPAGAVEINCSGKFIYPSFIDIYADYGTVTPQRPAGGFNFAAPAQLNTATKGAYGWNQAIKTETEAFKVF